MTPANFGNLLHRLNKHRSWKLERLSPTTYPQDITVKMRNLSEYDVAAIHRMMKSGECYRCRISKGRFFFGATMSSAIEQALKSKEKKARDG